LEPFFDFGLFEILAACAAWRVAKRGWRHVAQRLSPSDRDAGTPDHTPRIPAEQIASPAARTDAVP
jgi:hypothetical protein